MGCASSRDEVSKEEKAIIEQEEQLLYNRNNCKAVDFYIRKYSLGVEINHEQWRDIASNLHLKVENSPTSPKTVDFYNSMKGKDGKLALRTQLVLGILLAGGTAKDKAKLFFEAHDPRNIKVVSKADIHELVEELLDISINKLPTLVVAAHGVTEDEIKNYVTVLHQYLEKSKVMITKKFIGEETKQGDEQISLAAFEKNFLSEETARLLTPHGLRSFVHKQKPVELKPKEVKAKDEKPKEENSKEEKHSETHTKEIHHTETHHVSKDGKTVTTTVEVTSEVKKAKKDKKEGSKSNSSSSSSISSLDKEKSKKKAEVEPANA